VFSYVHPFSVIQWLVLFAYSGNNAYMRCSTFTYYILFESQVVKIHILFCDNSEYHECIMWSLFLLVVSLLFARFAILLICYSALYIYFIYKNKNGS
jgi:hypothetical protein